MSFLQFNKYAFKTKYVQTEFSVVESLHALQQLQFLHVPRSVDSGFSSSFSGFYDGRATSNLTTEESLSSVAADSLMCYSPTVWNVQVFAKGSSFGWMQNGQCSQSLSSVLKWKRRLMHNVAQFYSHFWRRFGLPWLGIVCSGLSLRCDFGAYLWTQLMTGTLLK